MKKLLPLLFLFAFYTNRSQTFTLTKGANDPIVGDSSKYYVLDSSLYVAGLNVGSTGANHVWSYTNFYVTPNTVTSAYIATTAVASASNYAGCTIVEQQGTLSSFYKVVASPSTQTEFMGISSSSLNMNFSNTALFKKYPFAIGDSFTDSFSGTFSFPPTSGTSSGNATVTADGTGTLNLPGGVTLNDVLRIKSYQYTSFLVSGIPAGSLKQTVYTFYHASQKFPILTINYSTITAFGSPTVSAVITGNKSHFVVGLKENEFNTINAKLYPNPVNTDLIIEIDPLDKPKEVKIYNQLGQTVYTNNFENKLGVSFLNSGIYFIEIKTEKGIARNKFIKN